MASSSAFVAVSAAAAAASDGGRPAAARPDQAVAGDRPALEGGRRRHQQRDRAAARPGPAFVSPRATYCAAAGCSRRPPSGRPPDAGTRAAGAEPPGGRSARRRRCSSLPVAADSAIPLARRAPGVSVRVVMNQKGGDASIRVCSQTHRVGARHSPYRADRHQRRQLMSSPPPPLPQTTWPRPDAAEVGRPRRWH